MANLTDLFPVADYVVGGAAGQLEQIYVYNTNLTTENNGGLCCQFTVPADTTWIRFEVWGAGGNGPGACCCQQPNQSGGAGAYARKTITSFAAGDTFTVCAGGTGCCTCSCCGAEGFSSFVIDDSVDAPVFGTSPGLCARGGPTACSQCFMFSSCAYVGFSRNCRFSSFAGHDFGLPAISGAARSFWCGRGAWQWVPQGPYIGGGQRHSFDYCCGGSGSGVTNGRAVFPGGGGGGAQVGGQNYCFGDFGAGGLIIITYR